MEKKDKYRNGKRKSMLDYSEGKLSGRERNAFEKELEKDPFEAEAAEGLSMISREDAEADLDQLSRKLRSRVRRNRRLVWYSAAAAVSAIVIVGTIFFNLSNEPVDLYEAAPGMEQIEGETGTPAAKSKRSSEAEETADVPTKKEEKSSEINQPTGPKVAMDESDAPTQVNVPTKKEVSAEDLSGTENIKKFPVEEKDLEVIFQEDQEENDLIAEDNMVDDQVPVFEDDFEVRDELSVAGKGVTSPTEYDPEQKKREALRRAAPETLELEQIAANPMPSSTLGAAAQADSDIIYGIVRSSDDLQPLPGVSLVVKGTTIGTVSDYDGTFQLKADEIEGETIVASYIGMEQEEFIARAGETKEISMLPNQLALEEVVVSGSGKAMSTNRTNAAETVKINEPVKDYNSAWPEGSMNNFRVYIDSSLVYPPNITQPEREVVVVKFIVSEDGVPGNFNIVRSPSESFSREAIRIIKEGPKWNPATMNGEYNDSPVRLRIEFSEEHVRSEMR